MYKVNKNGLWFRLHKIFNTKEYRGILYYNQGPNICPWFWKGIMAILTLLFMSLMALFFLLVFVHTVAFLMGGFVTFSWVYPEFAAIGLAASFIAALAVSVDLIEEGEIVPQYVSKYFNKDSSPKQPSLISTYYKAWKEKFCFQLEIKED